MNKIKNFILGLDLKSVLIIGLVIVLLLTRMFSSGDKTSHPIVKVDGKKYELIKHTIDTILVPKNTVIYKPGKTIYKDRTIYVNIPSHIDSASVVKEYYAENIYKDSLTLNNNLGQIYITDTISQNKIKNRKFEAKLKQVIIQDNTIVKELPKTQIYIGGQAGFDKKNLVNFVGPSLILKTKSDKLLTLTVGYGMEKNVVIMGGMLWKIKLHK